MEESSELEARVGRLEARVEEVAADAAAARHLAAARDRDLADLTLKVDANRRVISALGEHTRGGFDRLEKKVDAGLVEMRAGFAHVGELLTTLIDREPPPSSGH